jgi:hypothetical protein
VTLEDGAKFKGTIDMESKTEKQAPREMKPEGELLKRAGGETPKTEEVKKPAISYSNPTAPRT